MHILLHYIGQLQKKLAPLTHGAFTYSLKKLHRLHMVFVHYHTRICLGSALMYYGSTSSSAHIHSSHCVLGYNIVVEHIILQIIQCLYVSSAMSVYII